MDAAVGRTARIFDHLCDHAAELYRHAAVFAQEKNAVRTRWIDSARGKRDKDAHKDLRNNRASLSSNRYAGSFI